MLTCYDEMKVISGTAHEAFGEEICDHLGIKKSILQVGRFKDGEININIGESIRGCDVYLVQPTCSPTNDNLMELLILIDACKRASAGRISAVIPYYGYARQDKKTKGRDPITAKLVANMIETAGADRVIAMDLHVAQIQGFFDIPVDHLTGLGALAEYFKGHIDSKETVVVSPDLGGVSRARVFAEKLNLPLSMIEKRRPKENVSEVMNVIGEIEGKDCIIVDDMIDTAGTILNAAEALKDQGAKKVTITATHGVLSGPAMERIAASCVEECVVTNTIPQEDKMKETSKLKVVNISKSFAEVIQRVHCNDSVSLLF
ncbi:MAG: ribose-phosphate pyrophosphokinase [Gallicola sp.]|uniref:ribose-phosphate diphosphokinase n=1 Tax=Gallicola sp. Sow4_E12 TaxID=3438785 RepID=UPI0017B21681|nr:ribose-phosphate pyrophosphokinase [Gallicola sp.]